jgi:ketosteroid isomerase-like protein
MAAPSPREVFDCALELFLAKDMAGFADMFAADGTHELPFAPPGVPAILRGREPIRAYLTSIESTPLTLTGTSDLHVVEGADPELLVAEYEAHGTVTHTGKPFRMRYVQVLRARDGEIVTWRDYWNPLDGIRALGLRGTALVIADRALRAARIRACAPPRPWSRAAVRPCRSRWARAATP